MPISDKIKNEIDKLKIKDEDKELLLEILNIEDEGIFRFKKEYERIIKAYLENSKGVSKK